MTPFPDLQLHTTSLSSTILNYYFHSLQVLLSLLIYIWSSEQKILNISLLLYINVDNFTSSCPYDLEQTGCMLKKTCGFQEFMWLLIALDNFPLMSLLFSNHIFGLHYFLYRQQSFFNYSSKVNKYNYPSWLFRSGPIQIISRFIVEHL